MVDYNKTVGSAGTLRVRDLIDSGDSNVEFWVLCSDPVTNVAEYRFRVFANGAWSAWGTTNLAAGFGSKLLAVRTISSAQTVILEQQATGTTGLGGANSWSVAIPLPAAPSGLTITRVSDTQQTLNWSRNATYTSVVVQRRTDGGSWVQVGVAAGNAFTYTDTTTQADHQYDYRVAGKIDTRQSVWSGTDTVWTTPGVPSGVSAVRSGGDIVVSASTVSAYATAFDVRDGASVVASGVSLPWTHVAPNPADAHTYTVRAIRTSPDALQSAWSSPSNTVQLIAPPNAPVDLSPNGGVWPSDTDVTFSWTHNPVDSSPQSAFEVQWRLDGGAWNPLSGTTASTTSAAVGVGSVEWQARTKGAHVDWSPWSAVATVEVIDRPGVAVIQPDTSWDSSTLEVAWTFFQAQAYPQSEWELELLDGASAVVESRSGSGATTTLTANTRVTEGTWTVRVRAATGDVWSDWAPEPFTVTFDPPAPPVVSGVWDESQGGVQLRVARGENLFPNPSFEDAGPIPAGTIRSTAWAVDGLYSIVVPGPVTGLYPGASTYPGPATYPGGS